MARIFSFCAVLVALTLASCATPPPPPGQQWDVFFTNDDTTLSAEARDVVAKIAVLVKQTKPAQVTVEGQDDGGTPHDAQVATERGTHVLQALLGAGIPPELVYQVPGAPPASATGIAAHKVVVKLVSKH